MLIIDMMGYMLDFYKTLIMPAIIKMIYFKIKESHSFVLIWGEIAKVTE